MTVLRVGNNPLSGRLPLSLAQLPLVELEYADTGLCVPAGTSFRTWLNGIAAHEGTGVACGPPTEREVLAAFYEVTDGPNWVNSENWLTDAPLEDWYGVSTYTSGRVSGLSLFRNNLSGRIPPELSNLSGLESLVLTRNDLTGPIPPELANLSRLYLLALADNDLTGPIPPGLANLSGLDWLDLSRNGLTGPIPPELGDLARLEGLDLSENDLSGSIPPGLGRLTSLSWLYLARNQLTDPIPSELGRLTSLSLLSLSDNDLTGPIPPELGDLRTMEELDLDSNNLTGALPPELARIPALRRLSVGNNSGLSGPVPAGLTNLRLETSDRRGHGSLRPVGSEFPGLAGDRPPPSDRYLCGWRRVDGVPHTGGAVAEVSGSAGCRREGPAPGLRHGHPTHHGRHPHGPGTILRQRDREACDKHSGQDDIHTCGDSRIQSVGFGQCRDPR